MFTKTLGLMTDNGMCVVCKVNPTIWNIRCIDEYSTEEKYLISAK